MNKKTSPSTIILALILITLVVGGAVTVWSIRQVTQPLAEAERRLQRQLEEFVNPTPTIIPDPVTIVKEVRGLSRLETAAYTIEKIITAESQQGPLAFL
ncbi:MAG: hypothetical protein PVJ55_09810, partial [Anaerolineae bacterium]